MNQTVMEKVCDFDNLYKAMRKCKKGVMWKDSVARYCNNGLVSILKLKDSLLDGSYTISEYCKFTIHEPKTRYISSVRFNDRVFHKSLCDNYAYGAITKDFIYDNGACLKDKGTDFSRRRLVRHLECYYRRYGSTGWVASIDFKNFFGSTNHKKAKKEMARRIMDKQARKHIFKMIDSYSEKENPGIGIGLGCEINQILQLAMLSRIDHMIKEDFHIKFYVRYSDDIILIHHNKEHLQKCMIAIEKEANILKYAFNKNKTQMYPLQQGINFLGFKFILTETGKVVMMLIKDNIKKRKRKLRKHRDLVCSNKMTREKAENCFVSWKAHAKKGNSYKLIQRMDKYFEKLWEKDYD